MGTRGRWLSAALLVLAAMSNASAAIDHATVTGGEIRGRLIDDVAVFRGIPFAAPPVGKLRWQVPQPVIAWQGVLDAHVNAAPCIQFWSGDDRPRPSEDCLYLNVWTAALSPAERRPVIVWIHGGGLTGGMSWEKVSDGSNLAREGAVVVTIAYRLGALGFVAHPQLTRENGSTSGNYGLHDMVAALRWVQDNIARFGGDPARVLVIGGSAGAASISVLAAAPGAKGLYARAAAFGGASFVAGVSEDPRYLFFYPALRHAEAKGEALFRELGVRDLDSARQLPAEVIRKATDAWPPRFGIIRDGELVKGYNHELFSQRHFNDTPILIGYTSDEAGDPPAEVTLASARADLERLPCKHTHDAIAAAYPPLVSDEQTRRVVRQVNRDQGVGLATWTWARLQSAYGRGAVYGYFFDIHGPDRPHGAPHATEYPYIFGNFPPEHTHPDPQASALLRRYLINFAANGDPNGAGLPRWERYDEARSQVMVIGATMSSREWPNLAALKALTPYFQCLAGIVVNPDAQ